MTTHSPASNAPYVLPPEPHPPTAWESIPKLIRFVTWVYAILAVISLIGAAVFGLVFVLILGASL